MDRKGQNSVHSSSPTQPEAGTRQSRSFESRDTTATTTSPKQTIPSLQNPSSPPPIAINSLKELPSATRFTLPPPPYTLHRLGSTSPDTRQSPNPARQVFSYPVSYPPDSPPSERKMSEGDGPPPSQRRRLNSPENRERSSKSESDPSSRRGSGGKSGSGGMSYDPVHEYHQQSHQHHHSRRPSSAHSQHSHMSSYSAQSSNPDDDETTSPVGGDQSMFRDGKKRKHKCQECGQYFTRLHNLKSHLLTHSQEKPFICTECGHKFRRLHDLKRIIFKGAR